MSTSSRRTKAGTSVVSSARSRDGASDPDTHQFQRAADPFGQIVGLLHQDPGHL